MALKTTVVAALGAALFLTGCLSKPPPRPKRWVVEPKEATECCPRTGKWGSVRVTKVTIRAPYDGSAFTVMRPDGSVAFDAFNSFASAPAAMIRPATEDVVRNSGLFAQVIPSASVASSETSLEVTIDRLALDCRAEGACVATVTLSLALVKGREIVAKSDGAGTMPAAGDYSAAFSSALAGALSKALERL